MFPKTLPGVNLASKKKEKKIRRTVFIVCMQYKLNWEPYLLLAKSNNHIIGTVPRSESKLMAIFKVLSVYGQEHCVQKSRADLLCSNSKWKGPNSHKSGNSQSFLLKINKGDRKMALWVLPSPTAWVWSLRLIWWKERANSHNLASDLIVYMNYGTHTYKNINK